MIRFRESVVSAHHNYLVNDMLTPGFLVGDPAGEDGFWILADVVPPGSTVPRISGRLYDMRGVLLMGLERNAICENPGQCVYQGVPGGFRILYSSGEPLLGVHTEVFANGYLTRIQGKLYDRKGGLRMEPSYDGIQVYGDGCLTLRTPLRPL